MHPPLHWQSGHTTPRQRRGVPGYHKVPFRHVIFSLIRYRMNFSDCEVVPEVRTAIPLLMSGSN